MGCSAPNAIPAFLPHSKEPPKVVHSPWRADHCQCAFSCGQHRHRNFRDQFLGDKCGFVNHDMIGLIASKRTANVAGPRTQLMIAVSEFGVWRFANGNVRHSTAKRPVHLQAVKKLNYTIKEERRLIQSRCNEQVLASRFCNQRSNDLSRAGIRLPPSPSARKHFDRRSRLQKRRLALVRFPNWRDRLEK